MSETSIEFHNILEEPFSIHGLIIPENGGAFHRIPQNVAEATSVRVRDLNFNTAGGRVRFQTDSAKICICLKGSAGYYANMDMFTLLGCDLYEEDENGEQKYINTFKVPQHEGNEYISPVIDMRRGMKQLVINMPLYGGVNELHVGLEPDAKISAPRPYKHSEAIVFYGSSITQGGCATRPGLCYENHISRNLKTEYLNLGFSGNAKGEDAIANYMATLDMCAFVSDYDHNAPTPEHLKNTHFRFYEAIRAAKPNIPYIMISRPNITLDNADAVKRRNIIMESYLKAYQNGDRNVYFIDGYSLFEGGDRDSCTVDGCHPNDIGFLRMGKVIGDVLKVALHY